MPNLDIEPRILHKFCLMQHMPFQAVPKVRSPYHSVTVTWGAELKGTVLLILLVIQKYRSVTRGSLDFFTLASQSLISSRSDLPPAVRGFIVLRVQ